MGRLVLFLGMVICLTTSCIPQNAQASPFKRTGRPKAIVAVLPVINSAGSLPFSWDLGSEFTEEIRSRVSSSDELYLVREIGGLELASELNTPDPRDIPSDVSVHFGAAEFVVVSELLELSPSPKAMRQVNVLNMAMRLRVIDLRGQEPRVILQEVIDHQLPAPPAYYSMDYDRYPWGSEAFALSPMGLAHGKLVREVVSRVEGYVEATR